MTDLSDEAQALLDSARAAHEPSDADHRRVLRGVLQSGVLAASTLGASASAAALTGSAAAASGGAAATTAAAGTLGLTTKLLFGGILIGSASFGLYHASRPAAPRSELGAAVSATSRVQPTAVAARSPDGPNRAAPLGADVASADVAAIPASPALEAARRLPAATGATASIARHDEAAAPAALATADSAAVAAFPAQAAPESGPGPLSEEARALAEVQRALREGRSAQALALLEQQRTQFPSGALSPERAAAHVVALCALGRVDEARREGAAFLTALPHSPLAARIRSSCGGFPNGSQGSAP